MRTRSNRSTRGFPPTDGEFTAALGLLESYERGVAQGAGTIRFDERIVDRGAAAQAQALVELVNACAARDKTKAAALEGRPEPTP